MKKYTKIVGVAVLLAISAAFVGCGVVEDKVDEITNQKFEASNAIEKQNPEVAKKLEKPVSSEQDMINVINTCVEETTLAILGLPQLPDWFSARAAAKDVKSAEAQAEDFIKELSKQVEDSIKNNKIAVDFNKKIDIEALTIKDALEVIVEAYNETCEDSEDEITLNQLLSEFGIKGTVDAIDDFVSLDKFKFALDLYASEEKQKVSLDESFLAAVSVGDVNKLVSALQKRTIDTIPLRGAAVSVSEKVAGSISGEECKVMFPNYNADGNETDYEITAVVAALKGFKFEANGQASLAVLTSDNAGGYFTVEVDLAISQDKLEKIVKLAEDDKATAKDYVELADSILTVRISVTNGKKTTYTQTYNYTSLAAFLKKCGVDISDVIDGIF